MSTTYTEANVVDQVGDEVEGLLWKFVGTATSGGATLTTTDAEINKLGSSYAADRFNGKFLWIPSGTSGTDDIHTITTMSVSGATTTITTLGNYGATYTNAAMYIIGIHPNVFRRLLNDALELEYTDHVAPLSHIQGTDNDMAASGVTNWTDSSATSSKVTTVVASYESIRALQVANSGSSGYSAGPAMQVNSAGSYLFWAIGRSASGTAQATLRGASTNLVQLETTQSRYQYLYSQGNFNGDESVTVRLGSSGASDTSTWAGYALQPLDDSFFLLPSWASERFNVRGILRGYFGFSSGANSMDAFSRRLVTLKEGDAGDWHYSNSYSAVNSNAIEIDPKWLSYPLWIRGSRPYSDFGTFAAPTDTTTCPIKVLVPRVKSLIAERYSGFENLLTKADKQILQRAALRATSLPSEQKVQRMFS